MITSYALYCAGMIEILIKSKPCQDKILRSLEPSITLKKAGFSNLVLKRKDFHLF